MDYRGWRRSAATMQAWAADPPEQNQYPEGTTVFLGQWFSPQSDSDDPSW
jgi:fumarylacetoacetate (FAA) hydrolase family protein